MLNSTVSKKKLQKNFDKSDFNELNKDDIFFNNQVKKEQKTI